MKRNIEDICGYVYIMTNHCYPNLIKIGQTIKKPDVRANELSKSTGVIGEFVVEWFAEVPNRKFGEILGHNLFKKKQFQKEFFNLEVSSHYYLSDVLFYCKSMIFRWLSPEHRTSKYEQLLRCSNNWIKRSY